MPSVQRSPSPDPVTVLDHLATGEMEVLGRMPYSSNATMLVVVRNDGRETAAVYKPGRGERRLWDFPPDIYRRERAAYLLATAIGWDVVPPTVLRDDAPLGPGSVQLFIEADFEEHYFTLVEEERHHADLQTICVFDLLANNTDRKSGHCLVDPRGTDLGRRQRPVLLGRTQAAHGHLGLRRDHHPRTVGGRRGPVPGARAALRRWPICSPTPSSPPCSAGPGRWWPIRASRSTGRAAATPGRWSDPRRPRPAAAGSAVATRR